MLAAISDLGTVLKQLSASLLSSVQSWSRFGFQTYHGKGYWHTARLAADNLQSAIPPTWKQGRHADPVKSYEDCFSREGDLGPCGVEKGTIALVFAHGTPTSFDALQGEVGIDELFLGDGGLRYGFFYGCNILAHGPEVEHRGRSDYFHPERFPAGDQDVFRRWPPQLAQPIRMICASSTVLWDFAFEPTEAVWATIRERDLPISVAWIKGIALASEIVPLCLARGTDRPWQTPLSDRNFTEADYKPNDFDGQPGHIQILYPVWPSSPIDYPIPLRQWLGGEPLMPIFQLGSFSEEQGPSFAEFLHRLGLGGDVARPRLLGGKQGVEVSSRSAFEDSESWSENDFACRQAGVRVRSALPGELVKKEPLLESGPASGASLPWKDLGKDGNDLTGIDFVWDRDCLYDLKLDIAVENGEAEGRTLPGSFRVGGVVRFCRRLELPAKFGGRAIPVLGPGGGLVVEADAKGRIRTLELTWRPLTRTVASRQVRAPDTALALAFVLLQEELEAQEKGVDIYFEAMQHFEFGYREEGFWVQQEFMVPVYRFTFFPRESVNAEGFPPRVIEVPAFDFEG